MGLLKPQDCQDPKDEVIGRVCSIVNKRTGIQLGTKQFNMVESRLRRRMLELEFKSFEDYWTYLQEHESEEIEPLISLLTTHHTFFFREFKQFEYLEENLKVIADRVRKRGSKTIEILSAACSRGQEVYSLAMFLRYHLKTAAPDLSFKILGFDVDQESVDIASNGVYRRDEIKEIPALYMADYWARGTGDIADFVRAKTQLRTHCEFQRINLVEPEEIKNKKFDLIFCRNVFIYFSNEQIADIVKKLRVSLFPEGMLFVGASESLHNIETGMVSVGPAIYGKKEEFGKKAPESTPPNRLADRPGTVKSAISAKTSTANVVPFPSSASPSSRPNASEFTKTDFTVNSVNPSSMPNPLRVVCIDDSSSILLLLKKVLSKEAGFEVVGTGENGADGWKKVQELKPHIVTLDIHMPVETGVEYLKKHYGPDHPPVVMISSVTRDSADLAFQAMSLGASDYVEKPALNNLNQRAEEIRAKLKSSFRAKEAKKKAHSKVDKEFSKPMAISNPSAKARLVVFSLPDLDKVKNIILEQRHEKIPIFLAPEGIGSLLPDVAEKLRKETQMEVCDLSGSSNGKELVFIGELSHIKAAWDKNTTINSKCAMIIGELSSHGVQTFSGLKVDYLVLEDGVGKTHSAELLKAAKEVVPVTSFCYVSGQFFANQSRRAK